MCDIGWHDGGWGPRPSGKLCGHDGGKLLILSAHSLINGKVCPVFVSMCSNHFPTHFSGTTILAAGI